jgi:hypothetical protein
MDIQTIIILMLIAFIAGIILGLMLGRPTYIP